MCNRLPLEQQLTSAGVLGNHLSIYLEDNYREIVPLCNMLADKQKNSVCIRQAAYTLANIYDFKDRADAVCSSLTSPDFERCHQMYE